MTKRFALIGAAGYIAPRHMKAIKETDGRLVAAFDPNDSVGIIDSYFPDADFFIEFERFDRHIDKLRRRGEPVEYMTVCSPNYLHDAHIRFGLRSNAHVICEKPLVLNPWNLDALAELQAESDRRVYTILQLRLHPVIKRLRDQVAASPREQIFDIDLTYITSRGHWYYTSWKGDEAKSGGVVTNIGVHFFDMLSWIFGNAVSSTVHMRRRDAVTGITVFEKGRVRWFLSINANHLPKNIGAEKRTYRSILINDEELEFSEGFTDLHTESYRDILAGNGFSIEDTRACIDAVYQIKKSEVIGITADSHPLCMVLKDG